MRSFLANCLPQIPLQIPVGDRNPYTQEQTLDEFSQINISEIRTMINQQILLPVLLAHTPNENRHLVEAIMTPLIRDEQRHIAYAATILQNYADDGCLETLTKTYVHRFKRFNERTIGELTGNCCPSA